MNISKNSSTDRNAEVSMFVEKEKCQQDVEAEITTGLESLKLETLDMQQQMLYEIKKQYPEIIVGPAYSEQCGHFIQIDELNWWNEGGGWRKPMKRYGFGRGVFSQVDEDGKKLSNYSKVEFYELLDEIKNNKIQAKKDKSIQEDLMQKYPSKIYFGVPFGYADVAKKIILREPIDRPSQNSDRTKLPIQVFFPRLKNGKIGEYSIKEFEEKFLK